MSKKQMKNTVRFTVLLSLTVFMLIFSGCDTGPAKIESFKVAKDGNGKETATTFKANDKIHAIIGVSNNFDDTKLKSYMTVAQDFDNVKKGGVVPGTDGTDNLSSDKDTLTTEFSSPNGFAAGKYTVNVELLDKDGKKLDSKSADITIE